MDLFSRPAASCCYFSFLKKNHPAAPLYMEGLTKQQLSGPPGRELQEQLSGPQVIVYLLKILYSIIMKMGKHAQTYMARTHGRHTYVLTTQAVAALHGMTPVPFVLASATRVYLHPQGTKSAWHGPHVRPLGQVPTRARPGPARPAESGQVAAQAVHSGTDYAPGDVGFHLQRQETRARPFQQPQRRLPRAACHATTLVRWRADILDIYFKKKTLVV
jgi:hypothetical protein